LKNIIFDPNALEDFEWWISKDRKTALKVLNIIKAISREPFNGIGKPEPLKHHLKGTWFRRIDSEHRIVYLVKEDIIRILSCRYHY
jgi:toxin YoeB